MTNSTLRCSRTDPKLKSTSRSLTTNQTPKYFYSQGNTMITSRPTQRNSAVSKTQRRKNTPWMRTRSGNSKNSILSGPRMILGTKINKGNNQRSVITNFLLIKLTHYGNQNRMFQTIQRISLYPTLKQSSNSRKKRHKQRDCCLITQKFSRR